MLTSLSSRLPSRTTLAIIPTHLLKTLRRTTLKKPFHTYTPAKDSHIEKGMHVETPMNVTNEQSESSEYGEYPIMQEQPPNKKSEEKTIEEV